jgi:hypothetical protein
MFGANFRERMNLRLHLQGHWQDTFVYLDGRVVHGPWRANQIQDGGPALVQGLLARRAETEPGFTGVSYMAVGEGEVGWDLTAPTMLRSQETLTSEIARTAIPLSGIAFVDPDTFVPVGGVTRVAEYSATFGPDEANGDLREFGLFGGVADGDPDSGTMLNWITHPVFAKTSDFSLIRRVRITITATV